MVTLQDILGRRLGRSYAMTCWAVVDGVMAICSITHQVAAED
jgi:hypothetical protein